MITYKVTWDDGELVTDDWGEAVDTALFWKCDTILELLDGKPHAHVEPHDRHAQARAYAAACARIAERLREIGHPHAAYYQKLADEIREVA